MLDILSAIVDGMQYSFMRRALIAGTLIGISSSVIGVFLVLRRMSMIGDGLAHVCFATVAIGLLLRTAPLTISIPLVMAASILILKLTEKTNLYGDAAIGLIAGSGVAAGVMIASLAGGFNIDLFSYLFGNILSIGASEMIIAIALSVIVLAFVYLFYYDLFSVTYDEEFASVTGIKVKRINLMLTVLTSLIVVLGVRVAGTMLISSLIIFPAVIALQISKSFRTVLLLSALIAVISVISGILVSFVANLPAGASIVLINALFFLLTLIFKKVLS